MKKQYVYPQLNILDILEEDLLYASPVDPTNPETEDDFFDMDNEIIHW